MRTNHRTSHCEQELMTGKVRPNAAFTHSLEYTKHGIAPERAIGDSPTDVSPLGHHTITQTGDDSIGRLEGPRIGPWIS